MRSASGKVYNDPPEGLVAFDLRVDDEGGELDDARRAWSVSATIESLRYGRIVLVVCAGGVGPESEAA